MEKINIVELLRDCPKGMELDCLVFEDVTLYKIDTDIENEFPIRIKTKNDYFLDLTKYGTYSNVEEAKCVIFPKGKTTWEGFVQPVEFKDGDIIFTHANCLKVGLGNTWISIFQEKRNGGVATYVDYAEDGSDFYAYEDKGLLCMNEDIMRQRLATEEEKEKLFKAIKDKGYRWNPETKTLEKLPRFKVGDRIRKKGENSTFTITDVNEAHYFCGKYVICDTCDNNWELVPNKFDINTLKPFDKVLVKTDNEHVWSIQFFERVNKVSKKTFVCMGGYRYRQCVPYKGNEHLLNTSNEPDDFYKTWE